MGLNIQRLLNAWLFLNVLHFCTLLALAELDRRKKAANLLLAANTQLRPPPEILAEDLEETHSEPSIPSDYGAEGSAYQHGTPRDALSASNSSPNQGLSLLVPEPADGITTPSALESKRMRQGDIYASMCFILIVFAWVLFLVTAWVRLRTKAEREGRTSLWNL